MLRSEERPEGEGRDDPAEVLVDAVHARELHLDREPEQPLGLDLRDLRGRIWQTFLTKH